MYDWAPTRWIRYVACSPGENPRRWDSPTRTGSRRLSPRPRKITCCPVPSGTRSGNTAELGLSSNGNLPPSSAYAAHGCNCHRRYAAAIVGSPRPTPLIDTRRPGSASVRLTRSPSFTASSCRTIQGKMHCTDSAGVMRNRRSACSTNARACSEDSGWAIRKMGCRKSSREASK